jgi:uncharacterized membrane protein
MNGMSASLRLPAAIAYLPVIGWIYVPLFHHRSELAMFHVKQSLGLFAFLIVALVGWVVITWVLAWIPYGFLLGNALFALVIVAYFYGVFAWVAGIVNALRGRAVLLPVFGRMANRMSF